jgi:cytochrome b pre-mRNA-processing protein 3
MLDFLFRRLTAADWPGAPLFDALSGEARRPHWYVEGMVPDTLDGRFAVLATILALTIVRLEQDGPAGNAASVALTERFIEVMESEHRELGIGDPTLGKTVRRLVGSLARRTALWRSAVENRCDWIEATRESLYKGTAPAEALGHCAGALKRFWATAERASLDDLEEGKLQ